MEKNCCRTVLTTKEFGHDLPSAKVKKNWQEPKLIEIDYCKTSESGGGGGDLSAEAYSS